MFKLTAIVSLLMVAAALSFSTTPTAFVRRGGSVSTSSLRGAADSSLGPFRMIITGAPASGKGTQCVNIVKNHGLVHLSTGDMLRKAVKDKTPIGVEAEGYMNRGELVPDEVVYIADKLIQRDDDTEEKVKVRLQGFNKNVAAISGFYKAVGVEVDGNKKPEEVEVAVEEAIRSKVGK
ncbi:hypothetical protein TrRE_jg4405 [Triparma retinervis]|uniref:Adenylate kinase n=1 Tax=Triparma retinervis TaxID=2557542 RepID=A0A9W7C9M9_9STRA|nr:hypothetical protein TrRE_jg4405 [Triparma retinervis]